jgi:hypothetical protein
MSRAQKSDKARPLESLAKVRTGMQSRGYEKRSGDQPGDANARLIQARDVGPGLSIDYAHLAKVHADVKLAARHWLAQDQILFFGRVGQRYAVLLEGSIPTDLLADKVFFVIHDVKKNMIRADYLSWFLNSPRACAYFNAHETGSPHGIISKSVLQKLPVPVPDITTQAAVAETWGCWNIKYRLATKALQSEGRLIAARLENAAWGDATGSTI